MNPDIFYCPNKHCNNHNPKVTNSNWFVKCGYHSTKAFGLVPRYKCRECGKGFSDQTFSLNYYLKIKTDFKSLFTNFTSSNSDCFIARDVKMSFDSVQIRRERMARNAIFFQTKVLESHQISEPLCSDGLESYTKNKYYPNNINILMGKESRFLYYFTESIQKRKGRMTSKQKARIDTEYLDKSFSESKLQKQFCTLLQFLKHNTSENSIELYTDEHKTYERIIKKNNERRETGMPYIHHFRTSSKDARTSSNELSVINCMDMLIRKDMPNHRRKTICQARNDRNMLCRMACYMFSHNFLKPKKVLSRRKQKEEKHYDGLGLDPEKVAYWKELIFTYRMSISKISLPSYFVEIWFKKTATPLRQEADYVPGFAAA